MLALLGLLLISRFLARSWITNLEATRECNRTDVEAGQTIAFVVTVQQPRPAAGRLGVDRGHAAPRGDHARDRRASW